MKKFKDGEFACHSGYEISISDIDSNGRQTITMCLKCEVDKNNICVGTKIYVVNDFKHNSYSIYKKFGNKRSVEIKKGKECTIDKNQFLKFILKKKYNKPLDKIKFR